MTAGSPHVSPSSDWEMNDVHLAASLSLMNFSGDADPRDICTAVPYDPINSQMTINYLQVRYSDGSNFPKES